MGVELSGTAIQCNPFDPGIRRARTCIVGRVLLRVCLSAASIMLETVLVKQSRALSRENISIKF